MKKYLRLYWLFIKYSLIRASVYKKNFLIWSLVTIGWFLLNLIFYQVIYLNVDSIAGWSKGEILVLVGFYFIFDFFLWGVLWQNMRDIPIKINQGTLDLELVKPVNSQFLLSFRRLGLDDFNSFIFGVITILYGLKINNLHPGPLAVLLGIISVIIAFIYVYSAWFMTMCIAFWVNRVDNLHFLFPGIRHFWRIPRSFYKGWLKPILTFIIPAALITTLPTQFFVGIYEPWLFAVLAFFAYVTFKLSNWFFRISLKKYSSASS